MFILEGTLLNDLEFVEFNKRREEVLAGLPKGLTGGEEIVALMTDAELVNLVREFHNGHYIGDNDEYENVKVVNIPDGQDWVVLYNQERYSYRHEILQEIKGNCKGFISVF